MNWSTTNKRTMAGMQTLRAWAVALTFTLATSSTAMALVNLTNFTSGTSGVLVIDRPPLTIPSSFKIDYRTLQPAPSLLSNVGLSWTDTSEQDVSTIVERSTNGTTWTARKTFNTPLAGAQTYTDTGLLPDTKYCYRVTSYGPNQQFVRTSPRCALTQTRGDVPVWRTQLRVRVANVTDAGTDRWVSVALTLPVNDLPGGNYTGINYAIDDFETGSDVTYDLSQTSITTLRDISRISIAISHWDDMLCLRDLQLLVNGQVAFEKVWGNFPNTCKWLGGNGPQAVVIERAELRAHPAFAWFTNPVPSATVGPDELASRLESMIGTMLFQSPTLAWRPVDSGFGVEVSKKADDNAVHVKLPLEGLVGDLPNPDVDIEFDLRPVFVQSGTQWDLQLDVERFNSNVTFDWWVEKIVSVLDPICAGVTVAADQTLYAARCIEKLALHVEGELLRGFSLSSRRIAVSLPANCQQPTVSVAANGGLSFGCQADLQPNLTTISTSTTLSLTSR